MASETVTWTDADGVTHTRKVRKHHYLAHAAAYALTGGASGLVSAAMVASADAYNAQTRGRIAADRSKRGSKRDARRWADAKAKAAARLTVGGTCTLCGKPQCDGSRHLP